jgi:hypothetical protein
VNLKFAGIAATTVIVMGHAQSLQPVRPAFDVASVKPAPPDEQAWGYHFEPGGRTVVSHFSLGDLMLIA